MLTAQYQSTGKAAALRAWARRYSANKNQNTVPHLRCPKCCIIHGNASYCTHCRDMITKGYVTE